MFEKLLNADFAERAISLLDNPANLLGRYIAIMSEDTPKQTRRFTYTWAMKVHPDTGEIVVNPDANPADLEKIKERVKVFYGQSLRLEATNANEVEGTSKED